MSVLKFKISWDYFSKFLDDQDSIQQILEILKSEPQLQIEIERRVEKIRYDIALTRSKNTEQVKQLAEWIRVLDAGKRNLTDFEIIYDGILKPGIQYFCTNNGFYRRIGGYRAGYELVARVAVQCLLEIDPVKFSLTCHENFFKIYFKIQNISTLTNILQIAIMKSSNSEVEVLLKRCESAEFTDFTISILLSDK